MNQYHYLYHYPYKIDIERGYMQKRKDGTYFYLETSKEMSEEEIGRITCDYFFNEEEHTNWLWWLEGGRHVFSFSKELLEMLENTELDEIDYESFNLPVQDFYLSLKPLNKTVLKNSDAIIEGVYFRILGDPSPILTDEGVIVLPPNFYNQLIFSFVGDFDGLILEYYDPIWHKLGKQYGSIDFWNFDLAFYKDQNLRPLSECQEEASGWFRAMYFPEDSSQVTDIHLDALNASIQFVESTLKLTMNCLLYISLPEEDKDIVLKYPEGLPFNFNHRLAMAKTKEEISEIENKIEDVGISKINFVGGSFKSKSQNPNNDKSKTSLNTRNGYWTYQPVGDNLNEKRLTWVKPINV
nr:hypothetical protein [Bacteroidota bacterium]